MKAARILAPVLVIAAVVVFLAGSLGLRNIRNDAGAQASGPVTETTAVPARQTSLTAALPSPGLNPVATLSLGGPVWAVTFDRQRGVLWFPYVDSSNTNTLGEFDPRTRTLRHWAIPTTGYDGITTQIVVADDGAVWIAENYSIIRFDPSSALIRTLTLDQKVVGALPYALANPTEGTGISAIVADGSGLLVARFDVPSLTRISSTLTTAGSIALPPGVAGPTSLAWGSEGSLLAFSGAFSDGVLTVLAPDFSLRSQSPLDAASIRVAGLNVVPSGGAASGQLLSPGEMTLSSPLRSDFGPYSLAVPDPVGGQTVYDDGDGSILRVVNGRIVSSFQLPRSQAQGRPAIPPVPGSQSGPTLTISSLPADVYAMVDDSAGTAWCFVMATRTLYGVQL